MPAAALPLLTPIAQKTLDECPCCASKLALVLWAGWGSVSVFAQLKPASSTQRRVLTGSLALHGLLFAWLLHAPEPQLLMPNSVAEGRNGKVIAHLYFPTQNPDDSTTSSSDSATEAYRHQRLGHEKLIWKPSFRWEKS